MKFTDAATLSGTRRTGDGYLIAEAFAVRTGIQLYTGAEMGMADRDIVRVWRPEEEVRAVDSLRSFSHAPVTIGHPKDGVDATSWKDLAVGEVSTEATWHDGKIKLPLILKDAQAIEAVEAGTRELSAGYVCQLEITDGITPEGEPYDAIQRDIRINHLAVVPKGRAGSEFRIGDEAGSWGASPVHDADKEVPMTLRKIMVDGLQVETTDAGAQAIEKLTGVIAAKDAEIAGKDAKHATEIATKDAAIAKAEGERDAALAKVMDAAAIDKLVSDRAELVAKAKAIAPDVKTEGMADAAIRKAVVVAKLGDAMADKSEAYVDARFDILAEDAKGEGSADDVRAALADAKPVKDAAKLAAEAREAQLTSLRDGWKQPVAKH